MLLRSSVAHVNVGLSIALADLPWPTSLRIKPCEACEMRSALDYLVMCVDKVDTRATARDSLSAVINRRSHQPARGSPAGSPA